MIIFILTQTGNLLFVVSRLSVLLYDAHTFSKWHIYHVASNVLLADRTYQDLAELDVVERLTLPLVSKFLAQFEALLPHLMTDRGSSCDDGKYLTKCTTCIL